MAGVTNIPLTTLAPGSHDYGPTALADSDTKATLSIDRTVAGGFNAAPASTGAAINVYQSFDSGATWHPLAGATFAGGLYNDKNNQPYAASSVTVGLIPGTGRTAKANVTISGGSVAVAGSLTIS